MDRAPHAQSANSDEKIDFNSLFGFEPQSANVVLNCKSLCAIVISNPEKNSPPLDIPAIAEDHLIVHLSKPVQLSNRIENRLTTKISVPGTFSLKPPGTPSQWQISGNIATALVLFISHELFTRTAIEFFGFSSLSAEVKEKIVVDDTHVHQIGSTIYQELLAPGFASDLFIESLSQTLVIHLLRKYAVFRREIPIKKGVLPPPLLATVMEYIHAHLDRNITLEEIAGIAHLSTFHFARLFKQTLGVPVHQYVLQKRLDAGKELLMTGTQTITEVAARTGFVDASHFSRHFKRRFGNSPVLMRQDSKNMHAASNFIQDK